MARQKSDPTIGVPITSSQFPVVSQISHFSGARASAAFCLMVSDSTSTAPETNNIPLDKVFRISSTSLVFVAS